MKRLVLVLSACAALACAAAAQTEDLPLGDVARQVRGEKKPSATRVYDNDNLPKNAPLTVLGTLPESDNEASAKDAGKDGAKKAATKAAAASKAIPQQLAEKQQQLDLLKRELNVLQGEQKLQAEGFYTDAGTRLRDPKAYDQQAKQYQESIAAKQKEIESEQQEIDALKESGRRAGLPTSALETESKPSNGAAESPNSAPPEDSKADSLRPEDNKSDSDAGDKIERDSTTTEQSASGASTTEKTEETDAAPNAQ